MFHLTGSQTLFHVLFLVSGEAGFGQAPLPHHHPQQQQQGGPGGANIDLGAVYQNTVENRVTRTFSQHWIIVGKHLRLGQNSIFIHNSLFCPGFSCWTLMASSPCSSPTLSSARRSGSTRLMWRFRQIFTASLLKNKNVIFAHVAMFVGADERA